MNVGVYGGSFNPPHVGHAMVAGWLGWTEHVDEVWLLPTFSHPFDKELAPFPARVQMCEALARAVGPWVRVVAIESDLPKPSYTIDSLDALASRHPEHVFRLVVGSDTLGSVDKWKRWDEIVARYAPIVVGRDGYDGLAEPVFPDVSSTEVRRRLKNRLPIDALVPAEVRRAMGDFYA